MKRDKLSIREITKEMTRIRKGGGSIITNYYQQCREYKEPMDVLLGERTCTFVWPDEGLNRVYFYSTDEEELIEALSIFEPTCVLDYITKDMESYRELFEKAGFKKYLDYGRYVLAQQTEEAKEMKELIDEDEEIKKELYESDNVMMAEVSDAEEIDRQLREKFDPFEAHFYPMETLREYIRRGWVWVARENGKIIAANLFEIQGKKSYGAYLYNNGSVEVLTSLLAKSNAYVSTLGVIHSYCWMNMTNKRILRYNLKYNGYVSDGIYDIIYVKG